MATASLVAKISTTGASKAKTELKGVSTQAKKTESNVTKIGTSFKGMAQQASASAAAINGPMGGIASRISAVATVLTTGTAAATLFGVAITGIGFALASGVSELDAINIQMAKTEAILNATGFASGKTTDQLTEQARAIAMATLASTQGIQSAQAKLLTFDKIHGQVFDDAIALTQDLATVFGGDAASQATQLGKALQDPVAGLTALNRVGVSFTEQQSAQVKAMVASGDTMKAQTVIIEALKKQVGGAGESVAKDSLAGKLDTAGQLWVEFAAKLAANTGTMTLTEKLLNGMIGRLNELNGAFDNKSASEYFDEALDMVFVIGQMEQKLSGLTEGSRSYVRILEQMSAKERERAELLRLSGEVALSEQAEMRANSLAHEASQVKIKTDSANLQAEIEKTAREKQISAELDFLDKREAYQKAAREKQSEETRKALTADAEFYTNIMKAKEDEDKRLADEKEKEQEGQIGALGDLTTNLAATLGEQSAIYKAAAITEATINTYRAATGAYAALAGIPYIGPALGAAAAGVAIGAGIANVQAITSARYQGGSLAAGQSSTIAENNEIEVIAPANASRVRTAAQMKGIMGESGGNSVSLVVIDQSQGSKEYTQETQDDGRIILLIRSTVSADIGTSNTQIDKSLTGRGNARVR